MLNSIRVSLKNTLVYGLGNIAVKIIGFLLIPLYTDPHYFSVDEFGIMGLLDISGLVLTSILASSLPQSLSRWYYDKEHINNQKGIFFMSFSSQVVICILFCFMLFPLSGQFSLMIFRNTDWSSAIKLIVLASAFQAINNIINTLMRLQSKSVLYTVSNLSKLITVFLLTIYLVVFRHLGIVGIYLAQVIGNLLFIVLLSGYTIKNCKVTFNLSTWKSMTIYGFPILLANFSGVFFNVIDRYSLNSMSLLKYVAIYTLATKISSVLKLTIVDSIKLALFPQMVQKIDSPDNKRFYSKALTYSSFILMFGIITISLFSLELIKLIAKATDFWGAYMIIPILSLSVFFVNLREVSIYGLLIVKRTKIIGLIITVSSILNLFLNILLISQWNIIGAAVATGLSQLFYWFAIHYFAQKVYYIPYEIRKITVMFLCGAVLSFSSLLLNDMDLLPRLIIKTGCLVSFPFILYLFNFYEPIELQSIRGFVVKWSNIKNFKDNFKSLKGITEDE